ncbi:aldehyde dehydrogenase (NADP(+)) [Asticcacaulis endophyticus]|uniref:2,5-dioxovalerate dehydrogenase n=1 Tax=Asticcacaulis endophyticus TaxID=1395890 RepID=A0A918Q8A3_9CAUL|nr:aldehyde dehydrogenase (NADP(+)) [Asticcacaulis endophyticus]GGZ34367.1 2,5-dioxovalerate dehydrogenase [Asticcacaulis endophyticus]
MTTPLTGDLLIGARTIARPERQPWAVNSATGEVLEPRFVETSSADVDQAAELAWQAFGVFRRTSPDVRSQFLLLIAQKLVALGDELIDRVHLETAIPKVRVVLERDRTVFQLRFFAHVVREEQFLDYTIDPARPERLPFPKPDLRLRQVALGPVAVFGSSNFPLAFSVAGGDTASALAAGCPVIVKGHPAHPGTSEMVGRAIQAAVAELNLPEGVFSLLTGGIDAGVALVKHPRIKAVGFTGSRGGGMALVGLAAARPEPIPVYAEMSSVNPVYLLPAALEARAEQMGEDYVASLTVSGGQLCTNPGIVIALQSPALDRFVASASATLGQVKAMPMLTAGIHANYANGLAAFAEHADVVLEARGIETGKINCTPGAIFSTTAKAFLNDPALSHEVFGASSIIVRCDNVDEMMQVTESLEGHLVGTLHLEPGDTEMARTVMEVLELKVGRLVVNGWPTGVEVSPAMVHGGPFPATSDSRSTSVGTSAIRRFLRPVSYQNVPQTLLPDGLK